jgi:hypothetical protein
MRRYRFVMRGTNVDAASGLEGRSSAGLVQPQSGTDRMRSSPRGKRSTDVAGVVGAWLKGTRSVRRFVPGRVTPSLRSDTKSGSAVWLQAQFRKMAYFERFALRAQAKNCDS